MTIQTLTRLTLAATLVALGACSRDRAVAKTDTALEHAAEALTRATDSAAGRLAGREYTNAELIALLNAYNDAEIETGKLAETKATDTAVRNFARQITTEHQSLKTEVTATADRLKLIPVMPSDDEDLADDHKAEIRDLTAKPKGKEFDQTFIEHEVKMHKKVLDEVEDALGRDKNQDIRALLEHARDGLRSHLSRAEALDTKVRA